MQTQSKLGRGRVQAQHPRRVSGGIGDSLTFPQGLVRSYRFEPRGEALNRTAVSEQGMAGPRGNRES